MAYAACIALLAALLIAPAQTEFWAKVAVLGSLAIVCAVRPLLGRVPALRLEPRRLAAAAAVVLVGYTAAVAVAGIRARPEPAVAPLAHTGRLPPVAILPSQGVETVLDRKTARRIAGDLVANLDLQAEALSARRPNDLARAAIGDELTQLTRQISGASGGTIEAAASRLQGMRVWLEAGHGQGPAIAVVTLDGTRAAHRLQGRAARGGAPRSGGLLPGDARARERPGRWLVARVRSGRPVALVPHRRSAAIRRAELSPASG